MKKYVTGLCALLLMVSSVKAVAQTEEPQDIVVTNFQSVVTDLAATVTPVLDNNGVACAVIKFFVRDTTFVIEPNLGFLRRESKVGEIRLWVPAGTKRLTVRHEGMFPLRDFVIPEPVESKRAYHAYIWSTEKPQITKKSETSDEILKKAETKMEEPEKDESQPSMVTSVAVNNGESRTKLYLSPGFLAIPQTGLSMAVGINANHHIVEAGAAMALSKTDSLHYYNNQTWAGTYQYWLMNAFVKYGYECRTKGNVAFAYTPMLGIQNALSLGTGRYNVDSEIGKSHKIRNGMALSVSVAVRLALCLGTHFAWYVKPKYSIAAYKSDSYKLMMQGSDVFKKWAEGFSLETGFVVTL